MIRKVIKMSIDESIRDIVLGKEENISERYDKMRKEQMDRVYDWKHKDKLLFTYLLLYNLIIGR